MHNKREQILNICDTLPIAIQIVEWGVELFIKIFNILERNKVFDTIRNEPDKEKHIALVVVNGLVDEDNKPVFTTEDIPALLNKNGAVLERISNEIIRANKMAGNDIEEAKKN